MQIFIMAIKVLVRYHFLGDFNSKYSRNEMLVYSTDKHYYHTAIQLFNKLN